MTQRLTLQTSLLLAVAPLMWAGNAVVGRLVHTLIPPLTLNFFRWMLAFAILLPLAGWVLRSDSGVWSHWRRFALLGLLGGITGVALGAAVGVAYELVARALPAFEGCIRVGVPVRRTILELRGVFFRDVLERHAGDRRVDLVARNYCLGHAVFPLTACMDTQRS